jgi:hypothetical protein
MASKNKLFTLSYFRKRLKDAGFITKILDDRYSEIDKRYWTISIDKNYRIHCTCFKFKTQDDENCYSFMFTDGKQKIKIDRTLTTSSMKVIIDFLNSVINKDKEIIT